MLSLESEVPAHPLRSCVVFCKSLNLPETQVPYLKIGFIVSALVFQRIVEKLKCRN